MKFRRIQNRPLRMLAFLVLSPAIAWITVRVDFDGFVDYFKEAWRE